MTRPESAVLDFNNGCNCAQAVLVNYCERSGLDKRTASKIATGFGGGMRMGATCGAVTGAFMALGLKCGNGDGSEKEAKERTSELVKEFVRRFKSRNQTVVCKELLGCDVGTVEGSKTFKEKDMHHTVCADLVREAAEILEEMHNEMGQNCDCSS